MTRTSERRALFIAPAMPADGGNGLAIRLGVFAEALARIAAVDLVCIPVFGRTPDDGLLARLNIVPTVIDPAGREDTQFRLLSQIADPSARLAAFRRYGRTSVSARLSQSALAELERFCAGRHYDLAHFARAHMAEAVSSLPLDLPLSVDLDEDDAWSWRSQGTIATTAEAKAWSRAEAAAADRLLGRLSREFPMTFISSAVDGRRLTRRHPGIKPIIVANPTPPIQPLVRNDDGATVLFVGSFGYAPNLDGLEWFIADCWPRIRGQIPRARLRIVGRDMPNSLRGHDGKHGIEAIGAVDHLAPVYATATLAIAPLRAGGGTRIKLIEAAAYGVPIVATSIGARGLAFGNWRGMWVADTAEGFVDAVDKALADPAERLRRTAYAAASVHRNNDRQRIIEGLACRFAGLAAR